MPLVLDSSSSCDICFESFTSHGDSRPPFAIPCGHVFCRDCLRGMNPSACPMCREPFIPNSAVKLIAEDEPSDSGGTEKAAFALLKKLAVSWNLALSERDRIELMMEVEQWLESNGNTHEVLVNTLEMIRAHNKLNHDLEQLNAAQISLKEEANTVEQSFLSRLKETQLQAACLKAESSVYSRFTLDLPDSDRNLLARAFKEDGNKAFKSEEFKLSVSLFSRAIEVSSKHDAILYANRAVCYLNMTPQIPHLAIDDCNEAIKQDPIYVKAIYCRGIAYETIERFDDALDDFITTSLLDQPGIMGASESFNRILQKLTTEKALEILDDQSSSLPPFSVISAYFASFRTQAKLDIPTRLSTGDIILLRAFEALSLADYQNAMTLINEALDAGISISWREGRAAARSLCGSFKYLTGDLDAAKSSFLYSRSILPDFTQNLVKLARVHFEQGDDDAGFRCFEEAIIYDSDDPDIYHHRGQVYLERENYALAAGDFVESINLNKLFMPSHVQLASAYFKLRELRRGESTLRRMLELFPKRSEPLNYLGELHFSQRHYADAIQMFDRSFKMEEHKAIANVVPLLNKGRALLQWKNDTNSALDCYMQAGSCNPDTVAAIVMISELRLECSDFDEAMSCLKDLVEATRIRSKSELVAALSCQYVCESYWNFLKKYPELSRELQLFAHEKFLSLFRKYIAPLRHPSILAPTEFFITCSGTTHL